MLLVYVKAIELAIQARPKVLARLLFHHDPEQRHSMRWYTRIGRRVWFREIADLLVKDRFLREPPSLKVFWGNPQDEAEEAMALPARKSTSRPREASHDSA